MKKMLTWIILFFFFNTTYASLPYYPLNFPRDEGAHYNNVPYQFNHLTEWWYLSGKLTADDGRRFAYDIAFFNSALKSDGITTAQMLHMQLADIDKKKEYGVAINYPLNSGKISSQKLDIVLNDNLSLHKKLIDDKEVYILKAEGIDGDEHIKFNLVLEPNSSIFPINNTGLFPMPNGTNSYYYTIPHFKTTGSFQINQSEYHVNTTPGDTWMDHQWGDFKVQQFGWEWFSIRLENGLIANIFLNVEYKNHKVIDGLANIILPSGEKRFIPYQHLTISRADYWYDKKLSLNFPMTFQISIPEIGLKVENSAAFPEQEVHGYWEGYCDVKAVYQKQEVKGYSFAEMVYSDPTE